jgi:hypothetical protein
MRPQGSFRVLGRPCELAKVAARIGQCAQAVRLQFGVALLPGAGQGHADRLFGIGLPAQGRQDLCLAASSRHDTGEVA